VSPARRQPVPMRVVIRVHHASSSHTTSFAVIRPRRVCVYGPRGGTSKRSIRAASRRTRCRPGWPLPGHRPYAGHDGGFVDPGRRGGGHGPQARAALAGRAVIAPLSSPARPRVTTNEQTDERR
jgi:hypothetical protein